MDGRDTARTGVRRGRWAAVIGLALVALALAVVEGGLRYWVGHHRDPAERYNARHGTFELVPGAHPRGDAVLRVNAAGFAGPELSVDPPGRIVALGDSCTIGEGDGVRSYPAMLRQRLRARGALDEVVNAGVAGLDSAQVLARLEHRVLPLRPDVVLFYVGWNDLMKRRPLSQRGGTPAARLSRAADDLWLVRGLRKLGGYYARRRIGAPRTGEAGQTGRFDDFTPGVFRAHLGRMVARAQGAGAEVFLFTLPSALRRDMQPYDLATAGAVFPYFYGGRRLGDTIDLIEAYNRDDPGGRRRARCRRHRSRRTVRGAAHDPGILLGHDAPERSRHGADCRDRRSGAADPPHRGSRSDAMSAHAVTMSPGADPDALAAETADALRPPRESDFDPNPPHVAIFVALVFFLFLEYVRPPVISNLKFQMLFSILIPIFWATNKDRPWSPVIGLQIGMLAHAAISVAYAPNYFTAFMATRTLWANCVASLAIFWVLQRKSYFGPTVWVWALIMAYQAFYAATAGGGQGLGGFIGDENDLAMAAGTAVPFMLMGMQLFTGIRRWVSLVLLVVLIMGIVVSESRGGFLGLAGVVAYCLFYSKNRLRNFLIILVGGVIFALSIPSDYKEELSSISETKSGTAEARFFLWASAVNMWIDNPVLGVGAMNSPWLVGAYQPRGSMGGLFSRPRLSGPRLDDDGDALDLLRDALGNGSRRRRLLHGPRRDPFSFGRAGTQAGTTLTGRRSRAETRRRALRHRALRRDGGVPDLWGLPVDFLLPLFLLFHRDGSSLRDHDRPSLEVCQRPGAVPARTLGGRPG